jgi:hypothetical protein
VAGAPKGSIDDLRRDLAPPEPITSALSDVETYELEPPTPLPIERVETHSIEELGDAPAVAEPELVVTETMAEVFLRQGHLAEALTVYRELLRRSPDSSHLAARIADLESRQAAAAAPPSRPAYAAKDTGGQSVAALFQSLLAARPGDPPVRWPTRSEPTAPEPPPDAASATRPAGEPLSLGSIFCDEPPPVAPAMRNSAEPPPASASSAPVTFDDFFGAPRAAGASPPPPPGRATAARRGDDLEQFHAWLQSLKR